MTFETDVLTKGFYSTYYGKTEYVKGVPNEACGYGLDYYYNLDKAKKIVIVASTVPVKNAPTVEVSYVRMALLIALKRSAIALFNTDTLWWWVEIVEEF